MEPRLAIRMNSVENVAFVCKWFFYIEYLKSLTDKIELAPMHQTISLGVLLSWNIMNCDRQQWPRILLSLLQSSCYLAFRPCSYYAWPLHNPSYCVELCLWFTKPIRQMGGKIIRRRIQSSVSDDDHYMDHTCITRPFLWAIYGAAWGD